MEAARNEPSAVMDAVASANDRPRAAAAIARLLAVDEDLADQVIDLSLAEFLGRQRGRR